MIDRKLIVFDFDGTLVDSEPHFVASLVEFSTMKGLPFDARKMMTGYVDPLKNDLGWNIPFEEQEAMFEEYACYSNKELIEKKKFVPDLFDGMKSVLSDLKEKYNLAIVTARSRDTMLATMDYLGIRDFFPVYRTLCCARERNYPIKPAPDALICLLQEMNYEVENIVMVGDTNSDIQMAHNAGAKSIAVSWGLHLSEKLKTSNPTLFIEDVKDLPIAIEKIFAND